MVQTWAMRAKKTERDTCPLLSLPPELRNKIYEMVIKEDSYIKIPVHRQSTAGTQLPLTRTCRQIRGESLSMFYQLNTFRLDLLHESGDFRLAFCPSWGSFLGVLGTQVYKLNHIEIAACTHGNYFRLDTESGRLATANLEMKSLAGEYETDNHSFECVVNPITLARGKKYLKTSVEEDGQQAVLTKERLRGLMRQLESGF